MGAGKTLLAGEVARRLGRPVNDVDAIVEHAAGDDIPTFFRERGEAEFRKLEEEWAVWALGTGEPGIQSLGGGAVTSPKVRDALRQNAVTVWLDVDVETAWERVRGSDRPLAQDESAFRRLYKERRPLYEEVADAKVRDADDVVLAAARIHVSHGALGHVRGLTPDVPTALVSEPHVLGIHGAEAQVALGSRLVSVHELPTGEEAKTVTAVERLWHELRLPRSGLIVALGGGALTDAAGFAAATYLRGVPWASVPSSLVGQVDAGIGGKTAIDLPAGKNLVGAFHWPIRTVIDPSLLATLPERERREGMAEVVKTGLLADEPLWDLPDAELVRRCAAFKAAVCLRDPRDEGERAILNLGHTFAHALEAGGGYGTVTHGQAVALGLLAALRLSGRPTDVVEEVLSPRPVPVDRERAWAALGRDKKTGLVLLGDDGPRWNVEVPEEDVRRELDRLISQ
jgi:shikimate kinase/3-dehydroquinate synthase